MKPSRLIRHLNTEHSELVSKHTEFFMRKTDVLKIEKQVLTRAYTIDKLLLTSYLVALRIARCKITFSIGKELIKPSLIAVFNEVFGQSAASEVKKSLCQMTQLKV
jgi:hypothetical protein